MNQSVPVSQQITQLTQQLTHALVQKEDAQAKVDEANKLIVAIRNMLAGVGLGRQAQVEETAAKE